MKIPSLCLSLTFAASVAHASPLTVPHVFSNGTVASADAVNDNFAALAGGLNAAMTPVLLRPAEGASVSSRTRLEWAGGGGLYEVELDASTSFSNPFRATVGTTSVRLSELTRAGGSVPPGTWYWRVRATSGDSSWLSAARSVTFTSDGAHCAQVLANAGGFGALPSGHYWIKPGSGAAYLAYCDMHINGGGWTLVWTKVSPGFLFWKSSFDSACASTNASNCASAVNPQQSWTRALFRFADDASCWVQFDNRRHAGFRSYLDGAELNTNPAVSLSKSLNGHPTNETSVAGLHYYATNGISESHSGSDSWIDLWNVVDQTNGYVLNEDPATLTGTKCLCGQCRHAPVWMLVK